MPVAANDDKVNVREKSDKGLVFRVVAMCEKHADFQENSLCFMNVRCCKMTQIC